MKRPKKSMPKFNRSWTETEYSLMCPHCKTTLIPAPGKHILRIMCWRCNEPIDIIREEVK